MKQNKMHKSDIKAPVSPSSPVLNKVATKVPMNKITDQRTQRLIDDMFSVAYGRQGDSDYPTLVGLAAPQIGVSKRVVIIGMNSVGSGEQPELKEFINPVIINKSEVTEDGREGCFSTGRVCGIVERAQFVTVQAYDREGKKIIHTFEGFPARVAQHEVDHLDGIRFPDRITDDSKLHWVDESDFGKYRKEWAKWDVRCSREKWEEIKKGE